MPSTSQCLRLSEQSACTSQLPLPLLPSLSTFLPARPSVVVSRHPEVGGRSVHLRIVPSPTEATKHRHREDAARVENGIRRESQSAPHIPKKKKKKTRRFFSFTTTNQTTARRHPFQETSRCCFAGHLHSFVSSLLSVIRVHCLPAGSLVSFFLLSLSRMSSIFLNRMLRLGA